MAPRNLSIIKWQPANSVIDVAKPIKICFSIGQNLLCTFPQLINKSLFLKLFMSYLNKLTRFFSGILILFNYYMINNSTVLIARISKHIS